MNSHSTSAFSHPTRCRLSSAPVAQSVRAPNVRCQCASSSNGRADNDKAWMDVHMPALRDRLDDMRQRESTDGANGISDGSVPTGRRCVLRRQSICQLRKRHDGELDSSIVYCMLQLKVRRGFCLRSGRCRHCLVLVDCRC